MGKCMSNLSLISNKWLTKCWQHTWYLKYHIRQILIGTAVQPRILNGAETSPRKWPKTV